MVFVGAWPGRRRVLPVVLLLLLLFVVVVVVVLLLLSLFCSITTSVAKVASEPPFHTAFRLLKRRKLSISQ